MRRCDAESDLRELAEMLAAVEAVRSELSKATGREASEVMSRLINLYTLLGVGAPRFLAALGHKLASEQKEVA